MFRAGGLVLVVCVVGVRGGAVGVGGGAVGVGGGAVRVGGVVVGFGVQHGRFPSHEFRGQRRGAMLNWAGSPSRALHRQDHGQKSLSTSQEKSSPQPKQCFQAGTMQVQCKQRCACTASSAAGT